MKKLLFFLALYLFSIQPGKSESPFNIGLKYGLNTSTLNTNIDKVLNQNITENSINNYMAGAFARISLGRLYVQPEAYFNTKGGVVVTKNSSGESVIDYNNLIDYQSIDVPVLLGIKLINKKYWNIRANVGPLFSWVTSSTFATTINNLSYDDLKEKQMGWQAGIGVDIWFITLDGRFEYNHNIFNPSSSYSARNYTYIVSAGIKLF
jgi:hypothetical protein